MSSPLLGTVPPAAAFLQFTTVLVPYHLYLNTSSYNMLARFEQKLLQTDRHISISFISDTSPHYNYYDTVSVRFEHTIRRMTHILLLLLETSSRKNYYNYVSIRFELTLSPVNRHFRMSTPILDTSSHNLYNYVSVMFKHSLTCFLSCHVMGYAAPPYFAHHPYLIHRRTTITSKSRCGSNTL